MSRKPPERDVALAVQKLRVHYAKRGRLRFSSHRDFQRALERGLVNVLHDGVDAGLRTGLRDAVAHGAGADDADGLDGHGGSVLAKNIHRF